MPAVEAIASYVPSLARMSRRYQPRVTSRSSSGRAASSRPISTPPSIFVRPCLHPKRTSEAPPSSRHSHRERQKLAADRRKRLPRSVSSVPPVHPERKTATPEPAARADVEADEHAHACVPPVGIASPAPRGSGVDGGLRRGRIRGRDRARKEAGTPAKTTKEAPHRAAQSRSRLSRTSAAPRRVPKRPDSSRPALCAAPPRL